jgi:hypothetical protein
MKGDAQDFHRGTVVDLRIELTAQRIVGIDTLNGVQQALVFARREGRTEVRGLRVYDYPLVLRIE